jgi:hypothetical protein
MDSPNTALDAPKCECAAERQANSASPAHDAQDSHRKSCDDVISDVLPFSRPCYGEPNPVSNAISYAKFFSRSHDAVIRVYDDAGNVIEMHEHKGDFREP